MEMNRKNIGTISIVLGIAGLVARAMLKTNLTFWQALFGTEGKTATHLIIVSALLLVSGIKIKSSKGDCNKSVAITAMFLVLISLRYSGIDMLAKISMLSFLTTVTVQIDLIIASLLGFFFGDMICKLAGTEENESSYGLILFIPLAWFIVKSDLINMLM